MLPKNVDTERGRYLQSIIAAATPIDMMSWPELNDSDYANVAKLIVCYSFIDFNLRRLAEGYDDAGLLVSEFKNRTKKLKMFEVEKCVRKMLPWPANAMGAFNRISELRSLRNLFAHFAVKRFPNDDAFFFTGKSASDYKNIFGVLPDDGLMLTAVLEARILVTALEEVRNLQIWLAGVASDIAVQLEQLKA